MKTFLESKGKKYVKPVEERKGKKYVKPVEEELNYDQPDSDYEDYGKILDS